MKKDRIDETNIYKIKEEIGKVIPIIKKYQKKDLIKMYLKLVLVLDELFNERKELEEIITRSEKVRNFSSIGTLKEYVSEILNTSSLLRKQLSVVTEQNFSLHKTKETQQTFSSKQKPSIDDIVVLKEQNKELEEKLKKERDKNIELNNFLFKENKEKQTNSKKEVELNHIKTLILCFLKEPEKRNQIVPILYSLLDLNPYETKNTSL